MFKKVIKKNNIRGLCIPLWLLLKLHSSEYIGTTCKFLCLEFRMFALCEYLKKYHSAYKREKGKERRDSSKKILLKKFFVRLTICCTYTYTWFTRSCPFLDSTFNCGRILTYAYIIEKNFGMFERIMTTGCSDMEIRCEMTRNAENYYWCPPMQTCRDTVLDDYRMS